MAFALKASPSPSSSPAPTHPGSRGTAPGRLAARAVAEATPGRRVLRIPEAFAPVALSVAQTMSRVREQGKTAFIPFITAGDPDMATTAEALRILDACGADVIELGMTFSDSYTDGPVIQASAARALAAGPTIQIDAVRSMLKEVTPELSCPVVLVSYLGPIVRRGAANFTAALRQAGVQVQSPESGEKNWAIVSDLPYAEACPFRNEAVKNNLELVLLTTPATPAERMKKITNASQGFVYLVGVNGVTGPRATVNPRVKDLLKEIKQVTNKAVVVGFGISTPDHVRQISEWGADGVIVGSAMVKQLGEAASPREGLKRLEDYARSLKDALH